MPTLALVLLLAVAGGGVYYGLSSRQPPGGPASDAPAVIPASSQAPGAQNRRSVQPATLEVSSEPEGADVFVDNDHMGKTPLSLPLARGKHELRLNLTGYLEWEAQVDISTDHTPLRIPMQRLR